MKRVVQSFKDKSLENEKEIHCSMWFTYYLINMIIRNELRKNIPLRLFKINMYEFHLKYSPKINIATMKLNDEGNLCLFFSFFL